MLMSFLLLSVGSLMAQSDHDAVATTLNYYLDGGTINDFATLEKAFHPDATMQFLDREGNHKSVNAVNYFKGIMKPGPAQNRQSRITSIQINGNAASARIEIDYPNFRFIDYMNLLKIEGKWMIVSKIFHRENRS